MIDIKKYKDRHKFKDEASSLCKAAGISKRQAKIFCNHFIRYMEISDINAKRICSETPKRTAEAFKNIFDKLKIEVNENE